MKIAIVTEDGETISQHFGRAPYYMVYTVENGQITSREKRNKAGHHTAGTQGCHEDPGCHENTIGMNGKGAYAKKNRKHQSSLPENKVSWAIIPPARGIVPALQNVLPGISSRRKRARHRLKSYKIG